MGDTRTIELGNGQRMPLVGLGMWQTDNEELVSIALEAAIDAGYRHFDTALVYQNEAFIGNVLKKMFQSLKIKREDVFMVTKLPPNGMHEDTVEEFFRKSFDALQLDYLDLYLLHFPVATKRTENDYDSFPEENGDCPLETVDLMKIWKILESLVDRGLVKSIGLSNFNSEQIQRIYDSARIKPANLQIECHAYLPQFELVEFCHRLKISVTAYSPLGTPGLAEFVRKKNNIEFQLPKLMEEEILKPICEKYNKTPAQILLKYLVQRGIMVIPKSSNPKRIKENIQIFDFHIDDEEFDLLKSLSSKKFRYFQFNHLKSLAEHPDHPFRIPF